MERFIYTGTKIDEALSEFMSQLNMKFKSLSLHQKKMWTKLA